MSGYLKNILTRHIDITNNVRPYIPGKFETANKLFVDIPDRIEMEHQRDNNLTGNIHDESHLSDNFLDGYFDSGNHGNEKGNLIRNTVKKPVKKLEVKPIENERNRVGSIGNYSGNKSNPKEKTSGRETRKSNSTILHENDTKHESPINPESISSENKNEGVKPLASIVQGIRENSSFKPGIPSVKKSSSSTGEIDDSLTNTNGHVKRTPQGNGVFRNAENLSFRQTDLPDWLSDLKNNPGRESNAREVVQESKPVIRVNIGRIEVKAIMQSAPVQPKRSIITKPNMSLEDYLKKRDGVKQ